MDYNDDILDNNPAYRKNSNEDFAEIINLKREALEAEKKVSGGKTVTWIIIVLTIISAIYESTLYEDPLIVLGIYMVVVLFYVGGLIYSSQNPKIGLIVVFAVFCLIQLLGLIGNPIQFLLGLIFKIIIGYFFVQGIIGASKLEHIKKRLSDLDVSNI